tara:strand:- start:371 stop:664 length:294 start_codon:yes stop_codon:yes gene_type:complete
MRFQGLPLAGFERRSRKSFQHAIKVWRERSVGPSVWTVIVPTPRAVSVRGILGGGDDERVATAKFETTLRAKVLWSERGRAVLLFDGQQDTPRQRGS